MKSILELILEEEFDLIDKDDEFYFVSKAFANRITRSKFVLAVRDVEEEERIVVSLNEVASLASNKAEDIDFMLGYYPEEASSVDVYNNMKKYETAGVYVDLYEDGFFEEIDMTLIEGEDVDDINNADFWQNSTTLIDYSLEILFNNTIYTNHYNNFSGDVYTKNINGLTIDLYLEEIQKAIDMNWESLAFESNTVFARVNGYSGSILLETTGMVKIIDEKLDKYYLDEEIFENKELVKTINEGSIDEDDRYTILNNNWFSTVFFDTANSVVDDIVFESEPHNINDIIIELIDAYEYFVSVEKVFHNSYLVTVKDKYCFDGQISSNDYYKDLQKDDSVDASSYDKKNFFGEFVLSPISAKSEEDALDAISKKYEIEKEMLKAYTLA